MLSNRYPGTCNNPACKARVATSEGYITKINNKWVTWCPNCVPEKKTAVRRELTADGSIFMPYEAANLNLLRSIPGARWVPKTDTVEGHWTVSLQMGNRPRLLEIADRIGLTVAAELRKVEITEQATRANHAGLYPYQVDGVNFLSHRKRSLLGDEMGLGKTVQSLMSIPENGATLVICRAGLKYNWMDEVKKWRPDLQPIVLNGHGSFRWPVEGEVLITNNTILPDDLNTPEKKTGETQARYFDRLSMWREAIKNKNSEASKTYLIVDEAHDYKHMNAARTRKVREIGRLCEKVTVLTGSPLENRPEDLYNILSVFGMATTVFRNYEHFQELFNVEKTMIRGRGGRIIHKAQLGQPDPLVPELLRRVMLRRKRAEVLPDLPEKVYTNIIVGDEDMDSSLKAQLDALWEEWGPTVELDGELPPFEKFSAVREKLAKSRIPAMMEFVEDSEEQDEPLVIFSAHLAPLDKLLGRPGWAVINGVTPPEKRQEIVRAWNSGKLKGIGVSIQAGGIGLNLIHGHRALFIDLDWRPGSNWQAEDRLARIGQKAKKVEILRLVSNHPMDINLHNLLVKKIDTIIRAIDILIEGHKVQATNQESETDADFEERLAQISQNIEKQKTEKTKAIAKSKVKAIHQREKNKLKYSVLPLTPERSEAVRSSFKYMLSVCDGAHQRDNCGFNKPDAVVAHWLLSAGLETQEELEAGQYMLTRYHRQLNSRYPILFKDIK